MSRLSALFPAAVMLLFATAPLAAQPRSLAGVSASDVAAGQKIFDAQCAWCHGAGGTGGTGPNLHRATLRHAENDAALVQIVRAGIPGTEMPSFAIALTDRMARQTAAYVRSLGRTRARPLPGNAQQGAALYQSSGCAACHILSGQGGALGPELTRIGALRGAPYLRDALVAPAATHPPGYLVVRAVTGEGREIRGVRVNEDVFWILIRDAGGTVHSLEKSRLTTVERQLDASLMPSYATRFSEAQLDDVVAYLAGLRGEP
ncbi:MAG TPA: c-type cytochrome [Vicinamibacterales bacterium]|jgi:putative heme-binding domain-containing protein|nr:c-type cytochrome [Vicinamibacterales bacterium]